MPAVELAQISVELVIEFSVSITASVTVKFNWLFLYNQHAQRGGMSDRPEKNIHFTSDCIMLDILTHNKMRMWHYEA